MQQLTGLPRLAASAICLATQLIAKLVLLSNQLSGQWWKAAKSMSEDMWSARKSCPSLYAHLQEAVSLALLHVHHHLGPG